jgi:hypothetical protein
LGTKSASPAPESEREALRKVLGSLSKADVKELKESLLEPKTDLKRMRQKLAGNGEAEADESQS